MALSNGLNIGKQNGKKKWIKKLGDKESLFRWDIKLRWYLKRQSVDWDRLLDM